MKTYAAFYDNDIRMQSSSGGLFSLIATQFDVIYGVAMTEDCYGAEFIRTEDDISPLRGSKYFQAKIGETFKYVKQDLLEGKKVLFSGTGCQINGLKCFLQKDYSNLFCLDIICHGVPSPKLWNEYIHFQEKKYGKVDKVNFRCKYKYLDDSERSKKEHYSSMHKDTFSRMFLRNECLRPSCYQCHAKYYKTSDMTIADFWGIEDAAPEMSDGKGTSLVITRTDKGQNLFDAIKLSLKWKEVSYEDGVRNNPSEYKSVTRPKERETFFDDLSSISFDQMERKYAADIKLPMKRKIKNKIKQFVKKMCKKKSDVPKGNPDYGLLLTEKE